MELIEEEKKILDDKIDKSKFSFLVLKANYYKDLTEAMKDFNNIIKSGIKETQTMYQDIVAFE